MHAAAFDRTGKIDVNAEGTNLFCPCRIQAVGILFKGGRRDRDRERERERERRRMLKVRRRFFVSAQGCHPLLPKKKE